MGHELAFGSDGRACMLSVRETPWHREGIVLEDPPSVEEALTLARLDYEVALRPMYTECDGRLQAVQGFRATCRLDTGQVLGVVGERYRPLQNAAAFSAMEPLIEQGLATIETAGALRQGRDVWLLVRFNLDDPRVTEVFADEVVPFGLLSNNHAGMRQVVLQETPVRVVCANTLGLAHRTAVAGRTLRIRHTLGVEKRTVAAVERLWKGIVERNAALARQFALLKRCYLVPDEFERLVLDAVVPIPKDLRSGALTRQQKIALESMLDKRRLVHHLWFYGSGHRGERSAWEAYNGAVQALDHDERHWPSRGSRVQSLMYGRLGERKQRVLDNLVAHARKWERQGRKGASVT